VRAAVVQLNSTEDIARNRERADALTRQASPGGREFDSPAMA
jgi:predicted amidohydrolase